MRSQPEGNRFAIATSLCIAVSNLSGFIIFWILLCSFVFFIVLVKF